jgi:hypothetical protein
VIAIVVRSKTGRNEYDPRDQRLPTPNDIGNLSNAAPYESSVDCFALI